MKKGSGFRALLWLNFLQYLPPIARAYTFAVIPKALDNSFFDPANNGCQDAAAALPNVTCVFTGPPKEAEDPEGLVQASMVREMISSELYDGFAISVQRTEAMAPVIEEALQAGLKVVTFDSDAPTTHRSAYIGTDNYFFGSQVAKLVKQLVPNGGKYATVGTSSPNIQQRLQGFHDELSSDVGSNGQPLWIPLPGSPGNFYDNISLAIDLLEQFAQQNPTVLAPIMVHPMLSLQWKSFVSRHRDITIVSADATAGQLRYLAQGYVAGLVGQLPYEMGSLSIASLYALMQGENLTEDFIGTNVLSHILVPQDLPPLQVDDNLIEPLQIIGYFLFSMVALGAVLLLAWTVAKRNLRVIKVAQPIFLGMVALGVLVMATSLIPLSRDDGGDPASLSTGQSKAICMSVPWLASCGFTITFSALFSKTLRLNRMVQATASFQRTQVTVPEVMGPFLLLFLANVLVLALWTALDPLMYVRIAYPGTDGWNRIIATYGACRSNHAERYLAPLAAVNVGILIMANWEAYKSRLVHSEFSESRYIAWTMASLLQATMSGIPILFVVKDSPEAFYLVMCFMIFIICMAVLVLIFGPKVALAMGNRPMPAAAESAFSASFSQRYPSQNALGKASEGSAHQGGPSESPAVDIAVIIEPIVGGKALVNSTQRSGTFSIAGRVSALRSRKEGGSDATQDLTGSSEFRNPVTSWASESELESVAAGPSVRRIEMGSIVEEVAPDDATRNQEETTGTGGQDLDSSQALADAESTSSLARTESGFAPQQFHTLTGPYSEVRDFIRRSEREEEADVGEELRTNADLVSSSSEKL